jgi:predicted transcriptional regulator
MKYRSKTDIVAQMLNAASEGGITRTKMMYKAFLSYDQLREYLDVLIENGLLEYDMKLELFKTTEKGRRFITIYDQMGKFLVPIKQ